MKKDEGQGKEKCHAKSMMSKEARSLEEGHKSEKKGPTVLKSA